MRSVATACALAAIVLLASCSDQAITSSRSTRIDALLDRAGGHAASVTVSPATSQLAAGGSLQLSATVTNANDVVQSVREVSWRTSDPGVASVSTVGLVTGVTPGHARITASTGGVNSVSGYADVTVVDFVTSQINTAVDWDHSRQIGMFGQLPGITVVGQSFTVPAETPILKSFSFWLNGTSDVVFAAYVMAWDGTKAVGPVLWKS